MLDVQLLRNSPEQVKENLQRRGDGSEQLVDQFLTADSRWRDTVSRLNALRHQKNQVSEEIASLKQEGGAADEKIQEMRHVSEQLQDMEAREQQLKEEATHLRMQIPNVLHASVPYGNDEDDNVEVRREGEQPEFQFQPQSHVDVLGHLHMIDGEHAAQAAGHGFYYLKGDLVQLDRALQQFAIDFLMQNGYMLIDPPYMLRRKAYEGVTSLDDFEDVLYKIEDEDLHLIATAEHPLAAMYMEETLLEHTLPLKFVAVSPCFRKEVGAHGKYTKGLFRMHQFHKVEQFIFSHPDQSWDLHEELQQNAEELYQQLGLHYRVVNVCTGDIGIMAAKKYDMEAWMADEEFREVASNSNCTDYQARRLGIKYRPGEGQKPAGYVHTLNNTAIATSRTMIAIIEQYQQADGSVKIPDVLQPYMGGKKYLGVD